MALRSKPCHLKSVLVGLDDKEEGPSMASDG